MFGEGKHRQFENIPIGWNMRHETSQPKKREPETFGKYYMDVSENSGTPESSILIGVSIINHLFWGTPILWKHPCIYIYILLGGVSQAFWKVQINR